MIQESGVRTQIEQAFRERGIPFEPRFEMVPQQTLFSLVENRLGVTLLPQISVPAHRGRYVVAELREPEIARELCLIRLNGRKLSPAAQRCADMIISGLQNAVAPAPGEPGSD